MNKKKFAFIAPILGAALITSACTNDERTIKDEDTASYVTYSKEDIYQAWKDSSYTKIQLNGTSVKANGTNAAKLVVDGSTVTIKGSGTYVVEGTLEDGQLVVDTDESGTVRIVLNGASITSSTSAAINVINADKTVVSVEEGTENTLTDAATRDEDDEATGTIYAKDDLTINGEGILTVNANAADGIVGKDKLYVTGGNIQVTAADDGILGRDIFAMQNASITINAKGDGIKSTNDENEKLGNVVLESGKLTITAGTDGIDAEKDLIVLDGEYSINAGGGSPEIVEAEDEFGGMMPGNFEGFDGTFAPMPGTKDSADSSADGSTATQDQAPSGMPNGGQMGQPPTDMPNRNQQPPTGQQGDSQSDDASSDQTTGQNGQMKQPPTNDQKTEDMAEEDTTPSTKGLKAGNAIHIQGGTFTIDSLDDAVHSGGTLDVNGGTMTINTGDDGLHADTDVTIADGKVIVEKSYEALEGHNITIKGGHTELTAADDGINVNGGSSDFGMPGGQMPGSSQMPTQGTDRTTTEDQQSDAALGGKGVESVKPDASATDTEVQENNADEETSMLTIEGGFLLVNAEGDGLDSNGSIVMTGGTVLVYGPSQSMNGALDYDGTFELQGGILVAAGNASMPLGVSDSSTQNTVMMTFDNTLQASTVVTVQNADGNVVAAVSPTKSFQTIVISTPDMQADGEYILGYGGTVSEEFENGFVASGTVENVTGAVKFTFETAMTYLDSNGVTEAPSEFGGFGGRGMGGGFPGMQDGQINQNGTNVEGGTTDGSGEEDSAIQSNTNAQNSSSTQKGVTSPQGGTNPQGGPPTQGVTNRQGGIDAQNGPQYSSNANDS